MLIYRAVDVFFQIMYLLLIIRIVLSWIGRGIPYNSAFRGFIQFVYGVTEPILGPIRQVLPRSGMGIDFSPLIAFFLLRILQSLVLNLISSIFVI